MKFYCIALPNQEDSISLLKKACEERNIEFILVNPTNSSINELPQKGDLLYRVSDAFRSGVLELEYHFMNTGVTTFYRDNDIKLLNLEELDSFLLSKNNIPVPKTFFYLPENREYLSDAAESVGGFPLIVKVLGGSHGIGIIKVDSISSLYSVADFVRTIGKRAVLKQFIDVTSSARLIVLGNEVIDSIEYHANTNDFRSNEGDVPNVVKKDFDESIKKIAVQAVQTLGLEFGGVDILIDKTGKEYVAEVNFPCFFGRCQMLTGTDIAGMMIDYLIQKSQNA